MMNKPEIPNPNEVLIHMDLSKSDHIRLAGESSEEAIELKAAFVEAIKNRAIEINQSEGPVLLCQIDGLPSLEAQARNIHKWNFSRNFQLVDNLPYSIPLIQAGVLMVDKSSPKFTREFMKGGVLNIRRLACDFRKIVDFLRGKYPDQQVGTEPIRYVFLVDQEGGDLYLDNENHIEMVLEGMIGGKPKTTKRIYIQNIALLPGQIDLINTNLRAGWFRSKLMTLLA